MGTAEIYRAALAVDAVTDALVVDVDDWMPLFVVVNGELTDEVVASSLPAQDAGSRPSRALPYELNTTSQIDARAGTVTIEFANASANPNRVRSRT